MKILTIVLFAVILVSCGNKKAEIVEQLKIYKDSIENVGEAILKIKNQENEKQRELFWTNGEPDINKIKNMKVAKEFEDYKTDNISKNLELEFKQGRFEKLIDSLELELKKY